MLLFLFHGQIDLTNQLKSMLNIGGPQVQPQIQVRAPRPQVLVRTTQPPHQVQVLQPQHQVPAGPLPGSYRPPVNVAPLSYPPPMPGSYPVAPPPNYPPPPFASATPYQQSAMPATAFVPLQVCASTSSIMSDWWVVMNNFEDLIRL
jgi:hypothetical protein